MMPLQCATCAHYRGDNKCLAFLDEIPSKILTGEVDHDRPMMGQKNDLKWKRGRPAIGGPK